MAGTANHELTTDALNAVVSFSASGDNTLIAGVANQTIRLIKLVLVFGGATSITVKDGSTAKTGAMPFNSNGSLVLDMDKVCWVISAGSNFVVNSSNAVQVSGIVFYTQSQY